MDKDFSEISNLKDFKLWENFRGVRKLTSFDLEITSRCNNNCRHCYINLPAGDKEAESKELSLSEIETIADQAVELGALWCLLTGGEPLLRKDFSEIYMMLKRKGLLLSVFTSACLINEKHIELFKKYPPREIEITVYGITEETYENVTRVEGSYRKFRKGLKLLMDNGIKVRLKAMALRSNINEFEEIENFCREHTADYHKYDPMLHLRYDGNPLRNEEIKSERLTKEEIVNLEQKDKKRFKELIDHCDYFIFDDDKKNDTNLLFHCGAGNHSFTVSPEGIFRLCSSLWHPDFIYDLRKGTLKDAWENFVPKVLNRTSGNPEYLKKCNSCNIVNLCLWCPAHSHLETGELDAPVNYFCEVAHLRADAIKRSELKPEK